MGMLGLRYDLRVPDFAPTTHAEQYHACLEICDWADRVGFDMVALSEHHGVDDGYMSAPLSIATAVLSRTSRLPVIIGALLIPLHDPVRLAEQLAAIDLLAPGRLNIIAGLGYRPEEFAMADVDRRRRGPLAEEAIGVLRQPWTGEPFEWRGRTIRVTPRPATLGGPTVFVGGSVEAAARRAARLHCGFFAAVADPELEAAYREECAKVGYAHPFFAAPSGPSFQMVSDDPDATWAEIGPNAHYDVSTYSAWQDGSQRSTYEVHDAKGWEEVRASAVYQVLTPDEMVESINSTGAVMLHPLMGGISPEIAWRSLELFESKVLPRVNR